MIARAPKGIDLRLQVLVDEVKQPHVHTCAVSELKHPHFLSIIIKLSVTEIPV